jgi:PAS domain S-box-containing protein
VSLKSSRFSEFLAENPHLAPSRQPGIDVPDLVDESVAVFDLNFKVTAWNAEAERLYGWTREEVIGGAIQAAVRCEPSETLAVITTKVMDQGVWRGEFTRTTKSGAAVVVKAKWSLRRDAAGVPVDVVETTRDVTDIRRTEEAFERLQYQYQNLFQASVASFWELEFSAVADMVRRLRASGIADLRAYFDAHPGFVREMIRATRVLDVNERTVAMFGAREVITRSLSPFWPDESLPVFAASVASAFEGKPFFSAEAAFTSLGGQRYDSLFTVSYPPRLRDSSRLLVGIIDITHAKRAKAAQEASERRYRDVFDFMPIALFHTESREPVLEVFQEARARGVTDFSRHLIDHPELIGKLLEGQQITEVNRRTVDVLRGRSAADLVGSVERYWPESPQTFREIMIARYSGKKSYETLTRLTTYDGAVIDVLFFVAFAPITGKEHVSLVALIDVSDRVKAEHMLAKLQADIAHASRISVLGELTASIAHEVSQPLTAIEANTEASLLWLAHASPNIPEVRELCARTAQEVQRAADILHRIRSMAIRASPVKAPVAVNAVIEEALLFLRHELIRHDIETRLQLDPALPPILGDRVQLQQVLVNLAVNAIQSMAAEAGEPKLLTIRTASSEAHGSQVIEVEDTGPGIDPEALERLFEGFFTTKPTGMGIGLAICRTIIESHGGQISAHNLTDRPGAIFTIAFFADHHAAR